MEMLNRNHIAPRVRVMNKRNTYTAKPLNKDELAQAISVLRDTGIDNVFNRLMDDAARLVLDQILEDI